MTVEVKAAYAGEAQLIRWALSDGAGHTITLRINPDTRLHPFDGLPSGKEHGQRMQIVCVLIDDHEQPTDPDHARKNSTRHKARTKDSGPESRPPAGSPLKPQGVGTQDAPHSPRSRSQMAAIRCQDPNFLDWLLENHEHDVVSEEYLEDSDFCAAILRFVLGITSRKELDTDPAKGEAWDRLETDFRMRAYAR